MEVCKKKSIEQRINVIVRLTKVRLAMPGLRTPWLYAKSRCILKDFSIQPVASKTKASHVDKGRDYLKV